MRAQLRYELPTSSGPKRMAMLLIDPKHELVAKAEHVIGEQGEQLRLIKIAAAAGLEPILFFSDHLDLSPREKLDRLNVVLGTAVFAAGSTAYWQVAGQDFLERLLTLEQAYLKKTKTSLIKGLLNRNLKSTSARHGFWTDLARLLAFTATTRNALKQTNERLAQMLETTGLADLQDATALSTFLTESDIQQYQYRLQALDPMLRLLSDPIVTRSINFDPFPTEHEAGLSLRSLMDLGHVVAFQPEARASSEFIARALKALWYEAVCRRNDLQRPVSVIVDEFQRFVTSDSVSGDANFLDTARAFRANCLFATQSVAALLQRLGSGPAAQHAVDAILANCPSKWYLSSKDRLSDANLTADLPPSPIGREHVVSVRPLSSLKPGEAYWSLADGRHGRGRARLDGLL